MEGKMVGERVGEIIFLYERVTFRKCLMANAVCCAASSHASTFVTEHVMSNMTEEGGKKVRPAKNKPL